MLKTPPDLLYQMGCGNTLELSPSTLTQKVANNGHLALMIHICSPKKANQGAVCSGLWPTLPMPPELLFQGGGAARSGLGPMLKTPPALLHQVGFGNTLELSPSTLSIPYTLLRISSPPNAKSLPPTYYEIVTSNTLHFSYKFMWMYLNLII